MGTFHSNSAQLIHTKRLSGANLKGAREWTAEQLTAAESLEGATMPDGQVLKSNDNPDGPTLEEWLKSQGRKKDSENE